MNPNEALLFLLVPLLAAALVATGYWLGRTVPVAPATARRRAAEARRVEPRPLPADRASRRDAQPDTSALLRHDIESRVQTLRRSREPVAPVAAAPRLPVATPIEPSPSEAVVAAWFADTAIEPHTASRTH